VSTQWTIGRRIGAGFSLVLVFLTAIAATAVVAFVSVRGELANALASNELRNEIAQREIDHLNWAKQVSDLLTDDSVTQLTVQTDPHKCAFGKWYYGEGRAAAERIVPAAREALAAIEEPHRRLHESAITIAQVFHQADEQLPAFLTEREVDHLKWVAQCTALFFENQEKLDVNTDPRTCKLGEFLYGDYATQLAAADPEMANLLDALRAPHERLHASATQIKQAWRQRHPGLVDTLQSRLIDHERWSNKVLAAIVERRADLGVQTDPTQCAFGKFLASEAAHAFSASFPALAQALEACQQPHRDLHASALGIADALRAGDTARAEQIYTSATAPALAAIGEHFGAAIAAEEANVQAGAEAERIYNAEMLPAFEATEVALQTLRQRAAADLDGMHAADEIFAKQTTLALKDVQKLLTSIAEDTGEVADAQNQRIASTAAVASSTVSITGAVALVLGVALALLITRGIVRPVRQIVAELTDGSNVVASASHEVGTASTALAEASTEQASALEQTTAALEQMNATTQGNAEGASRAEAFVAQTRDAANASDESMSHLSSAMDSIEDSSAQISKIIKVIEEIAFQTNLLALNAAVEAARAGEHGKGFAVVADEVRSLAQRAAQAAGETTHLIETSVARTREGVEVTRSFGSALATIVQNVNEVSTLIGGISRASREQADGVNQINTAVSQMDAVTQSIAASAEQSASAVEELDAQATVVAATAARLAEMVGHGQ